MRVSSEHLWKTVLTVASLQDAHSTQPSYLSYCSCLYLDGYCECCETLQVLMIKALTTAVFMPNPFYTAGLLFFLPMAVQGGISAITTLLIFPRSVSSVFLTKFGGIIDPLLQGMLSTETLFAKARDHATPDEDSDLRPEDRLDDWAEQSRTTRAQLLQSLSGVAPLRALAKYLIVDFSYSRLSGNDLKEVFEGLVLLQIRSAGLGLFYDVIVSNARHSHIDSSAFQAQNTSRPPSRVPSVVEMTDIPNTNRSSIDAAPASSSPSEHEGSHRHFPFFSTKKSSSALHNGHAKPSHSSLLDHLRKAQQPVGVYESQRYMDIEKVFEQYVDLWHREHELIFKGYRFRHQAAGLDG